MAKFTVTTTAADLCGNKNSEVTEVKSGPATAGLPTVSFKFPATISVRTGNAIYPAWGSDQSVGFAPCFVYPTASANGTGRFLVQQYDDAANFPGTPARRFEETFGYVGTTLAADWALDPSGLSFVPTGSGYFVAATGTARPLVALGAGDDASNALVVGWSENPQTGVVRTVSAVAKGLDASGNIATLWPSGTPVQAHPYHFAPAYENDGIDAVVRTPVAAVIEEGTSVPLRGLFAVSGTTVSGQYALLTSELSGIVGSAAVRFSGSPAWFVVANVLDADRMTICDYGLAPVFSGATAEVARFVAGSGEVTVLPSLDGCDLWSVALSPAMADGDVVLNSGVTYTATLAAPSGATNAPSGTLSYTWQVYKEDASGVVTLESGVQNSASPTFTACYQNGVRRNVRVLVSGAGQPRCVHSAETGLIRIQVGTAAGVWGACDNAQGYGAIGASGLNSVITVRNYAWWYQDTPGTVPSGTTVYFSHWLKYMGPLSSDLRDSASTFYFTDSVTVPKGQLAGWPSQGQFVFTWDYTSGTTPQARIWWATYAGKQATDAGDKLTGVVWQQNMTVGSKAEYGAVAQGASLASIAPSGRRFVTLQSNYQMPFTWVVGAGSDAKTLKVESIETAYNRGSFSYNFWLVSPSGGVDPLPLTLKSVRWATRELLFAETIPSGYAVAGAQLMVAPWYHWRNGTAKQVDPVRPTQWNALSTSFMQVLSASAGSYQEALSGAASFQLAAGQKFDLWIYDPVPGVVRGMAGTGVDVTQPYLYQQAWLPYAGKIVVPAYDRKTVVVEYGSRQVWEVAAGDCYVKLSGCRLATENCSGIGTAATIAKGTLGFVHKTLSLSGSYDVRSGGSPYLPTPNHPMRWLGQAGEWYDLIYASTTSGAIVGDPGMPVAPPIWETSLSGFPKNAIPQLDPVYNNDYYTYTSGGSAGGTTTPRTPGMLNPSDVDGGSVSGFGTLS
jgi:hypothetical protein